MNYVVAIPSYGRAKKLRAQTLDCLASEGIDPQRITVFVASEEERKEYEKVLLPDSYGRLVVGVKGLCQQLNFIRHYYPERTPILRMDDDVKRVKKLCPQRLGEIVERMFLLAQQEGVSYWGFYPCNNLYFCKDRVVIGKVFCVGPMNGFFNDRSLVYPDVSCQEDRWMSLTCYVKDGKTMRYEGLCPDTVYQTSSGLSDYRKQNLEANIQHILLEFPELCHRRQKKKGNADVDWKMVIQKKFPLFSEDS